MTLAEAKLHLRVDVTADDDLISSLIMAAAAWVVEYCGAVIGETEVTEYFDAFRAKKMPLGAWPVTEVTAIDYITADTVNDYDGSVDVSDVRLISGVQSYITEPTAGWPDTSTAVACVRVTYTAGTTTATYCENIRNAMKLLIGFWYQHREDMPLNTATERSVAALLRPYRRF